MTLHYIQYSEGKLYGYDPVTKGRLEFKPEQFYQIYGALSSKTVIKEGEVYPLPEGYRITTERVPIPCPEGLEDCEFLHTKICALLLPIREEPKNEPLILHHNWDTALTNAIVVTNGRIQPYTEILKYLNSNFAISTLEPTIAKEEQPAKPSQLAHSSNFEHLMPAKPDNAKTFTICNGKITHDGFCSKCGRVSLSSSVYCIRTFEQLTSYTDKTPTVATDSTVEILIVLQLKK